MHGASLWKAVAAALPLGSASVFAQVDFSHTITLGSIILGVLLTAVAGLFTIRTQVVNVWRQTAEGRLERIKELEIDAKDAEREHALALATLEREQLDIRHDLKAELAACKAELTIEKAKHDLGSVIEQMNNLHHEAIIEMRKSQGESDSTVAAALVELGGRVEAGQAELHTGQQQTLGILTDIRDALSPSSS